MAVALPSANGQRLAFNVALPTSRMSKTREKRIAATLLAVAADEAAILYGSGVMGVLPARTAGRDGGQLGGGPSLGSRSNPVSWQNSPP